MSDEAEMLVLLKMISTLEKKLEQTEADRDVLAAALQNRIELLESAVRALAHELAVWRSMPHLDHIMDGYWADIQFEDMMTLTSGRLVNENQIARDAVNAAMAKEAK